MVYLYKKTFRRAFVFTTATLAVTLSASYAAAGINHFGPGKHMPARHSVIRIGPLAYFFLDGLFYRPGPRGYIVTPAPVGAMITALPQGAILVYIDGLPYYTCSGTYYKKTGSGYVVVSQPVKQMGPDIGIGQTLLVNVDLLNVRSGPGLNYEVMQQIGKDTVIEVESVSSDWCLIRLNGKSIGWIRSIYTVIKPGGAMG